jgi:hypothetical protein
VEPLSNSIATAFRLRLVAAAMPVLNVLLKDGLVVSGEVLESTAGIAYLSLGGKRVPAETAIEMRPGQKFTARVEKSGDGFVLRVLDDAPQGERALVAALRTVLADDRPTGALVSRLVAELVEHAEKLDPKERERVRALLREIERSVLVPRGPNRGGEQTIGPELKSALARTGLFHEALLAHGGEEEVALARADLKSVVLRALQSAPEGVEREALQRALAGIEAEQLLDVARTSSGDARQIGIAVPDGAQLATAAFVVHPDGRRDGDEPDPARGKRAAVDLAVSFTHLGPVRAEFRLDGPKLAVRFLVASPDVAARVSADADALAAGIADGGMVPALQVVTTSPDHFAAEPALESVSFLRDHPLLDRLG